MHGEVVGQAIKAIVIKVEQNRPADATSSTLLGTVVLIHCLNDEIVLASCIAGKPCVAKRHENLRLNDDGFNKGEHSPRVEECYS